MRSVALFALLCCRPAIAANPVLTAWIMSPPGAGASVPSRPDVHSVAAGERYITVRSAGLSLKYLGPLQLDPLPAEGPRELAFEIPIHPQPEQVRHQRLPNGVIGVFLNGIPIYNQFQALSWNSANIWHYDSVAYGDDGAVTALGHPRPELTHPTPPGLLEQLIQHDAAHSPLIGFALDGYPVYGPWAYARPDGSGGLRRMRSSYRLRSITRRRQWPDGTALTPEQYGPDVSAADPLGAFVEDYEYRRGAGDLDEFNGRFAVTPEYPFGTYAYYLSSDEAGRLAFPYLIGPRFYGTVAASEGSWHSFGAKRISLSTSTSAREAGRPLRFRFEARNRDGDRIRYFEYVHERPIHVIIASADLSRFDHIHPELTAQDCYEVEYTFTHGGRYRLWADYSLPGEAPRVDSFDIDVAGPRPAAQPLTASHDMVQAAGPFHVQLMPATPLRAGEDIPVTLRLTGPVDRLEPYLGAWAHIIVIGDEFRSFAHVHPIESAASSPGPVHTHVPTGPAPDAIHIRANFPASGLYKLWAQFQFQGEVLTVPFVLRVAAPAAPSRLPAVSVPPDAIRVRVTQHGFEPARIEIPAHTAVTLAFQRDSAPNCGSQVVFPALGIRRPLPPGGTVLVPLPAQAAQEIAFGCGMGMYRGMVVAR